MLEELRPGDLLAELPADLSRETFETLLETGAFRLERIVSRGQATPEGRWLESDTHEWVMVIRGRARLEFEGVDAPVELGPGGHVTIPARRRHRVTWTDPGEPTVWLALHYA
ncbi:cupin domain-containing protein [Dissulfurirhabdus thermomarina]|uniref:Cupin domain-containing protein n=2 Tax=Dissulfurirhabdus thermomarina TaxID=1765737 RepID=A0A6N9TNN4_DISTH|nr:cupin domain-containing protein [Dissulfurirhabdus thermomarina]NDY42901.1 cupin domain-containing protein [Dissulfurirhabdus thermomarina]NMX24132.1 cupin domain-containing protein [Dissulfurirhabdus thermomarina]